MTREKKKKSWKRTLLTVGILVAGVLLLNLFLSKRLEKYLKKELVERTAKATDGFYRLSFDNLSISFFKGELKLEGISFGPDPAVFKEWEKKDSLPEMYVTAEVGVIDFKGLNLTWTWNFKQLHFHSFEINRPDIRIFSPYHTVQTDKPTQPAETKTLYEVISPYIDVLSVKTLNLRHASVSYTAANPLSPIIYALTDVSFRAYGFWLDKNSSQSGKLLYSDNFEFVTNQPQTLLTNNDFVLKTDSIRLSTEDSLILVQNTRLVPQGELWKEKRQMPDRSLEAQVKTVEAQGVRFQREKGLNYLTARSFDIASSDLRFFSLSDENDAKKEKKKEDTAQETDSLVNPLSLYDIISPVLHRVAIGTIDIENAKLEAVIAMQDTVEIYKLNNFNFQAYDFLIDSAAEVKHGWWYSQHVAFQATGIEGLMNAHNHRLEIERMELDTEKQAFGIDRVRLEPLSLRSRNDYMAGSIDSIRIEGLYYDKGIRADLLQIEAPNLRYFVAPTHSKSSSNAKNTPDSRVDVEGILNPFLQYLSVGKIKLNKGYFTLHDKSAPDPVTYKLNNFNFTGTDILMNENSGLQNEIFFQYKNLAFSFNDFDNYLPEKAYRLRVKKGVFSTVQGELSLYNLQLLPQKTQDPTKETTRIQAATPLLRITGLTRIPKNPTKNIQIASFSLKTPSVDIRQPDGSRFTARLKTAELKKAAWDSTCLNLGALDLIDPNVTLSPSQATGKKVRTTSSSSGPTDIYKVLGGIARHITLDTLNLKDANIRYSYFLKNDSLQTQASDTTRLYVKGLKVDTDKQTFSLDNILFSTRNLAFPLNQGFYTLKIGDVYLDKKSLQLHRLHLVSPYSMMEFAYFQPHHKDWFDVSVGSVSLTDIDLPTYFSNKILRIGQVNVQDAVLKNFKNQQILIPHHIVPMIYSGLQKAPLKVDFGKVKVSNFSVIYKELAKKGTEPGTLFITDMNGTFTGFTNIVKRPDQFIELDADGKFMGKGYFTATWMLPVDSLNDRFFLNGHIREFDLTALNELITPLASAKVESGFVKEMKFAATASSKGATIDMLFLYNDLKAALLKEKEGELVDKKFLTTLANWVLKHDNPDKTKEGKKAPRTSHATIVRDPYHSSFNYIWQILRPALIESVGVSQTEQKIAKGVTGFFKKVKNFFTPKKKKQPSPEPEKEDRLPEKKTKKQETASSYKDPDLHLINNF